MSYIEKIGKEKWNKVMREIKTTLEKRGFDVSRSGTYFSIWMDKYTEMTKESTRALYKTLDCIADLILEKNEVTRENIDHMADDTEVIIQDGIDVSFNLKDSTWKEEA